MNIFQNNGPFTLQLKWPFGQTGAFAAIILLSLLGLCEMLARTETIQIHLPPPSVGSSHRQFEMQLTLLNRLIKEEGSIDCIFLGSSLVYRGINPEIFMRVYKKRTGQELLCFNFGVLQLTAATAGSLATILVDKYHPKLLIYGFTARDFSENAGEEAAQSLMNIAWAQYLLGEFSIEGWLIEHSYAYRYYLVYRNWMRVDFKLPNIPKNYSNRKFGFLPKDGLLEKPNAPPPKSHPFFEIFDGYSVSASHLVGLDKILNLREDEIEVIVVEMPVPRNTYLFFYKDFDSAKNGLLASIRDHAKSHHVLFIETTFLEPTIIPENGWADWLHLNKDGAKVFSFWLGEQITKIVP